MATIVEIAVGNENFQTLVTAVKVADLVDVLNSPGPFTVFAPVDAAFAQLPGGTIQTLVQNPPQLARILKFHVVPGIWKKADLVGVDKLTSVEGSVIPINASNGKFEAKNATVIMPDVEADNGVIHVIDRVMLMGLAIGRL